MKGLYILVWHRLRKFRVFRNVAIYCNMLFRSDENIVLQDEIDKLRKKYYSNNDHNVNQDGICVIYMVDGRASWKVGLSDRIRGAVFTYMICKELGVDFRVNFSDPFELNNYLEPNMYDWRIDQDKICYNSELSDVFMIQRNYESWFEELESKIKYNYIKKLISNSDKKQIHIYTNMLYKANGRYSKSFAELFKPTPIVQNNINHCLEQIGGAYINVTLRFQSLLGDFKEGHFKPLSDEGDRKVLIAKCESKIVEIHKKHPNKIVLVTSDSKTFLNHINKLPYTYIIDGDLVHMAFSKDNSLDLHKKAFVDYLMIAGAEKIYLLTTGAMYPSGFPQTASLIYNKLFKHIKF